MEKYQQLKKLVSELKVDVEKFYEKNNKAAGVRIRKAMLEARTLAHDIRKQVSETKQGNKER